MPEKPRDTARNRRDIGQPDQPGVRISEALSRHTCVTGQLAALKHSAPATPPKKRFRSLFWPRT
jgi:hypothetical protein